MTQLPVYQLPCNIKKPINIWHLPVALLSSPPANGLHPYHRIQIAVDAGIWLPLEIIIFIVRPQSIIRIISESALIVGAAAGNGALWASDNCTNSAAYRGSGFVVCSCISRIVCIFIFSAADTLAQIPFPQDTFCWMSNQFWQASVDFQIWRKNIIFSGFNLLKYPPRGRLSRT